MSYIIYDHACRFCGAPVNLKFNQDFPPDKIPAFKAMAACNRCADYRREMYRIRDRILFVCGTWRNQVLAREDTAEKSSQCRDALVGLTKKFCAACCGAFKVANEFHPFLASDLFDRPQHAYAILKDFEARFKPLFVPEVASPEPTHEPA